MTPAEVLETAVRDLTEPKKRVLDDGTTVASLSLIEQLQEDVLHLAASQGRSIARSKPPVWLDAVEFLALIENTVRATLVLHAPETLQRLEATNAPLTQQLSAWASLAGVWATTAPGTLQDFANLSMKWLFDARELIDPSPRFWHASPCPECDAAIVYRDHAGESVRQIALHLEAADQRVTCRSCGMRWSGLHQLGILQVRLEEKQTAGEVEKLRKVIADALFESSRGHWHEAASILRSAS